MPQSLEQLLASRFSQWPNRLSSFLNESTETQQWLLQCVLGAHAKAETTGAIQPLYLATANKNGAVIALREIANPGILYSSDPFNAKNVIVPACEQIATGRHARSEAGRVGKAWRCRG